MSVKAYNSSSVYEETLDRIRNVYNSFDNVIVSFSGGKDSTVVLNCALVVAKELNRLPIKVCFFDEEAIHPPTIEYVERVRDNPDIDLDWFCFQFKHRNACSNIEPFWYCWDEDKKDKWVRELPEKAITEHKSFKKGMSFQETCPFIYNHLKGSVAMLTGIRTEESLRRLRVIIQKRNKEECYINPTAEARSNQYRCFPIYDWNSEDVWLAVNMFGWDYNKTYDIFNKTKMFNKFLTQRVCPPFGEEPLRGLWIYSECFPEMWHKMLNRVEGVGTAWRYANSELYLTLKHKPVGISWKEMLGVVLESYEHDAKKEVTGGINRYINEHKNKTKDPIQEETPHHLSGVSWQNLCRIAIKGDFKRRQATFFTSEAVAQRARMKKKNN